MTTPDRVSKHHILVVDGDSTNAKLLKFLLEDEGYKVTMTHSASEALDFLESYQHELVTLDTDLPGADGLELCRRIRARSSVPIIFVASRGAVEDRVAGLKAGADDYVPKPFEPGEVLARVWALLRRVRQSSTTESVLRTSDLTLFPFESKVTLARNGKTVDLTPVEMRLLRFLVSNAGRSLTRDALVIKVWGYEYESSSNQLDVYISRLRTKIEPDPSTPRLILTVRGVGYKYQPSSA